MRRFSTFIIIAVLLTTTCCFSVSAATGPEIAVPSAFLMDQTTGTVLFEKNADEQRAPASVTKI